jgi:hypothetical protein
MSPVSYQTIKLSRGKHKSPEDGACVMELASMLAGETFTDHPASVCPVIASLLRAYNDWIDDDRRRDLYAYAAKVLDSKSSAAVQRTRAERLAEWRPKPRRRLWPRLLFGPMVPLITLWQAPIDAMGVRAVQSIPKPSDETHTAVLALVDELLAIGTCGEPRPARRSHEVRPRTELSELSRYMSGTRLW